MRIGKRLTLSAAALTALVSGISAFAASTPADAAQAWTCTCRGEKKRFLASTRFCEKRSGIAKGEWCSREQWRSVYGPACCEKGCRL